MKKIKKLEYKHFEEQVVDGVKISAMTMLTDEDTLNKINEIIEFVNKLDDNSLKFHEDAEEH